MQDKAVVNALRLTCLESGSSSPISNRSMKYIYRFLSAQSSRWTLVIRLRSCDISDLLSLLRGSFFFRTLRNEMFGHGDCVYLIIQ
jgi:hypothetical protein